MGVDYIFVYFVDALRRRRFLDGFGAAEIRLAWSGFTIDVVAARQSERAGSDDERGRSEGA